MPQTESAGGDATGLKWQSPLALYVVFDDACAESCALASHLFRWFRLHSDDGSSLELGLPIWYRCRTEPVDGCDGQQHHQLKPRIQWEDAKLNVIVVLASDRMVKTPQWWSALERDLVEAKQEAGRMLLLPVAVNESLYQLHFLCEHHQSVRIGPERDPSRTLSDEEEDHRIERRARRLRRQVMEATARAIRNHSSDPNTLPPPLQVFISHAKRDGRQVAETVRDQLARNSQMTGWYDANELPPGSAWNHPMQTAVQHSSAALLSIVSDAYATRFWCRKEVRLAREPLPLHESNHTIWTQQPAVGILLPGQSERRPMVHLNRVVHLSWPHATAAAELPTHTPELALKHSQALERERDRVEETVDRLLLEVLLEAFHRKLCVQIREHRPEDPEVLLLAFVPDPWSLRRTLGRWRRSQSRTELPRIIAYPGVGLRSAEVHELHDVIDDLVAPGSKKRPRLVTLEALGKEPELSASPSDSTPQASPQTDHKSAPMVVLSAGGRLDEMAPTGGSPDHVNDMVMRLSLRLLRDGWRLSFGGTLGNQDADITKTLLEVARSFTKGDQEQDERKQQHELDKHTRQLWHGTTPSPTDASNERHQMAESLHRPPLVNYNAWPNHRLVTERHRAGLVGICQFVDIPPPGQNLNDAELVAAQASFEGLNPTPQARAFGAHALTAARTHGAESAQFRVAIGGRIHGWRGWLPGVAEEVLVSLQQRTQHDGYAQPFVILGAFGGCGGLLAEYLGQSGSEPKWLDDLTFKRACKSENFAHMIQAWGAKNAAETWFQKLRFELEEFRRHLWQSSSTGPLFETAPVLTRDLFRDLLVEQSPASLVHHIRTIARAIQEADTPRSTAAK